LLRYRPLLLEFIDLIEQCFARENPLFFEMFLHLQVEALKFGGNVRSEENLTVESLHLHVLWCVFRDVISKDFRVIYFDKVLSLEVDEILRVICQLEVVQP